MPTDAPTTLGTTTICNAKLAQATPINATNTAFNLYNGNAVTPVAAADRLYFNRALGATGDFVTPGIPAFFTDGVRAEIPLDFAANTYADILVFVWPESIAL